MIYLLIYLGLFCLSFFLLQKSWRQDLDVLCEDVVMFIVMSFFLLGLVVGPVEFLGKWVRRLCGGRLAMKRY